MRRFSVTILFLTIEVLGCNQAKHDNHYRDKYSFDIEYDLLKFNKAQWLVDSSDLDHWYRREYMMKDLLDNHLKFGMTKADVIDLLGQPYAYPSTYAFRPNYNPDPQGTAYKLYGDSLKFWLGRQEDSTMSILKYNRGFSGSGPNLLIIVFDKDDKVVDFLTADAM